ncbi:uracil permease [Cordyceps fumosorosea ARSEF 2679]|uniref:Uracil permease n=1 Tax=Cordyceps fumosorosea (strain ARSEF 2679) TaxID=1081104 RepID=A0A162MB81_CORFA|nr:uracil permease [Cordyceps fumosorosea ARSEF 2679]OAA53670.1 uracil permease [Cordyceps fumosorosea ARSEF 2679]
MARLSMLFSRLVGKLALDGEPGVSGMQLMLASEDLQPVPRVQRRWTGWNFVGFWIADAFNIATWMIASSMIVGGLSWWQAWLAVWLGYGATAIFIVLTGRIGAVYHVSFPVMGRASFGIWGSLWPVFNRVVMACVWYGINCYIGGHAVYIMIHAIWTSWDRDKISNTLGNGTTTADFASFIIFWLCSLPALWFPVYKIRHLFTVKAWFVPPAAIAYLVWVAVKAGGMGPIVSRPGRLHGGELAWAFVKGVMSCIANFATVIINDSDFTRFARRPRDALWSQLVSLPVSFAFTSLVGILVSSASAVIYGEPVWDPLQLLERLFEGAGAGDRFGIFVIALAFALAQLGTNIAANSVSAGTDMTALLPRYLNIRRGSYICAAVGLSICPWVLLKDSNTFLTYLSAYAIFLSAMAGVITTDYYLVRRGYLNVPELYSARKTGPYFYCFGVHWRAYAAYIAGILVNVVGFAGEVGATVPIGAIYLFNVNFFGGFIVSSAVYWVLCRVFPIPETRKKWSEVLESDTESDLPSVTRSSSDEQVAVSMWAKGT